MMLWLQQVFRASAQTSAPRVQMKVPESQVQVRESQVPGSLESSFARKVLAALQVPAPAQVQVQVQVQVQSSGNIS